MALLPVFRGVCDGNLIVADTDDAIAIGSQLRQKEYKPPLAPKTVNEAACSAVDRLGGDISNKRHLMVACHLWQLENALGHAAYVVNSHEKEMELKWDNRHMNKRVLQRYMSFFPECQEAQAMKKNENAPKVPTTPETQSNQTKPAIDLEAVCCEFESGWLQCPIPGIPGEKERRNVSKC